MVERNNQHAGRRPVFLKIAPDLTNGQIDDIVDIVLKENVDGIVATNTTISREGLRSSEDEITRLGAGGISGVPVRSRSTDVVRYLSEKGGGQIPIIGVGGIDGVEAAREKREAGASLVQVYSGLIYQGPGLPGRLVEGCNSANQFLP